MNIPEAELIFEKNLINLIQQHPSIYGKQFQKDLNLKRQETESNWKTISRALKRPVIHCINRWVFLLQTFFFYVRMEKKNLLSSNASNWAHYQTFKEMQPLIVAKYVDLIDFQTDGRTYSCMNEPDLELLIGKMEKYMNELVSNKCSLNRRQSIWAEIGKDLLMPVIQWQKVWWDLKQRAGLRKVYELNGISISRSGKAEAQDRRILKLCGISPTETNRNLIQAKLRTHVEIDNDTDPCDYCDPLKTNSLESSCTRCSNSLIEVCDVCLTAPSSTHYKTNSWSWAAKSMLPNACRLKSKVLLCKPCKNQLTRRASLEWKVCRICSQKKTGLVCLISEPLINVLEVFYKATMVKLDAMDGLPCYACTTCKNQLVKFSVLYTKFLQSQDVLRHIHANQFIGESPLRKRASSLNANAAVPSKLARNRNETPSGIYAVTNTQLPGSSSSSPFVSVSNSVHQNTSTPSSEITSIIENTSIIRRGMCPLKNNTNPNPQRRMTIHSLAEQTSLNPTSSTSTTQMAGSIRYAPLNGGDGSPVPANKKLAPTSHQVENSIKYVPLKEAKAIVICDDTPPRTHQTVTASSQVESSFKTAAECANIKSPPPRRMTMSRSSLYGATSGEGDDIICDTPPPKEHSKTADLFTSLPQVESSTKTAITYAPLKDGDDSQVASKGKSSPRRRMSRSNILRKSISKNPQPLTSSLQVKSSIKFAPLNSGDDSHVSAKRKSAPPSRMSMNRSSLRKSLSEAGEVIIRGDTPSSEVSLPGPSSSSPQVETSNKATIKYAPLKGGDDPHVPAKGKSAPPRRMTMCRSRLRRSISEAGETLIPSDTESSEVSLRKPEPLSSSPQVETPIKATIKYAPLKGGDDPHVPAKGKSAPPRRMTMCRSRSISEAGETLIPSDTESSEVSLRKPKPLSSSPQVETPIKATIKYAPLKGGDDPHVPAKGKSAPPRRMTMCRSRLRRSISEAGETLIPSDTESSEVSLRKPEPLSSSPQVETPIKATIKYAPLKGGDDPHVPAKGKSAPPRRMTMCRSRSISEAGETLIPSDTESSEVSLRKPKPLSSSPQVETPIKATIKYAPLKGGDDPHVPAKGKSTPPRRMTMCRSSLRGSISEAGEVLIPSDTGSSEVFLRKPEYLSSYPQVETSNKPIIKYAPLKGGDDPHVPAKGKSAPPRRMTMCRSSLRGSISEAGEVLIPSDTGSSEVFLRKPEHLSSYPQVETSNKPIIKYAPLKGGDDPHVPAKGKSAPPRRMTMSRSSLRESISEAGEVLIPSDTGSSEVFLRKPEHLSSYPQVETSNNVTIKYASLKGGDDPHVPAKGKSAPPRRMTMCRSSLRGSISEAGEVLIPSDTGSSEVFLRKPEHLSSYPQVETSNKPIIKYAPLKGGDDPHVPAKGKSAPPRRMTMSRSSLRGSISEAGEVLIPSDTGSSEVFLRKPEHLSSYPQVETSNNVTIKYASLKGGDDPHVPAKGKSAPPRRMTMCRSSLRESISEAGEVLIPSDTGSSEVFLRKPEHLSYPQVETSNKPIIKYAPLKGGDDPHVPAKGKSAPPRRMTMCRSSLRGSISEAGEVLIPSDTGSSEVFLRKPEPLSSSPQVETSNKATIKYAPLKGGDDPHVPAKGKSAPPRRMTMCRSSLRESISEAGEVLIPSDTGSSEVFLRKPEHLSYPQVETSNKPIIKYAPLKGGDDPHVPAKGKSAPPRRMTMCRSSLRGSISEAGEVLIPSDTGSSEVFLRKPEHLSYPQVETSNKPIIKYAPLKGGDDPHVPAKGKSAPPRRMTMCRSSLRGSISEAGEVLIPSDTGSSEVFLRKPEHLSSYPQVETSNNATIKYAPLKGGDDPHVPAKGKSAPPRRMTMCRSSLRGSISEAGEVLIPSDTGSSEVFLRKPEHLSSYPQVETSNKATIKYAPLKGGDDSHVQAKRKSVPPRRMSMSRTNLRASLSEAGEVLIQADTPTNSLATSSSTPKSVTLKGTQNSLARPSVKSPNNTTSFHSSPSDVARNDISPRNDVNLTVKTPTLNIPKSSQRKPPARRMTVSGRSSRTPPPDSDDPEYLPTRPARRRKSTAKPKGKKNTIKNKPEPRKPISNANKNSVRKSLIDSLLV